MAQPEIIDLGSQDSFNISVKDKNGKTMQTSCSFERLGLPAQASHVLMMRLNPQCRVTPNPEIKKLPSERFEKALHHDRSNLDAFTEGLAEELNAQFGRMYLANTDTAVGDLMFIVTDAADQEATLHHAAKFITKAADFVVRDEQRWRHHLEARGIDHKPPGSLTR